MVIIGIIDIIVIINIDKKNEGKSILESMDFPSHIMLQY